MEQRGLRTTVEELALKNRRENNFLMLKREAEMERKPLLSRFKGTSVTGVAPFPFPTSSCL